MSLIEADEAWCQAALTPTALSQEHLVIWFQRYFEKFGDKAPNRKETDLIIMAKKNIYQQYSKETIGLGEKPVSESTFLSVWNTVFPRCINRPWCDVPGKCDICGEIDRQRRECQEEAKLEQLKQAHHIHRGGMFMLERLE